MYVVAGLGVSMFGLPERTPSFLQGILQTSRILYTVVIRFLWLQKGLSARRIGCTVILLIGIFISLEPQVWSLPGTLSPSAQREDADSFAGARVMWPVLFSFSFIPTAVVSVLCERELKKKDAQPLNFMLWTQIFVGLTILPFFWVDFLPYVGTSTSLEEVCDHIRKELSCHFSSAESCHSLAIKGWVYTLAYCFANLLGFLLIQRAEGAVFAMIVMSMVTPLSTLFWTFVRFDEASNSLYWQPEFTVTTGFTLLGLVIIVPAVVMYNVFSRWDAQNEKSAAGGGAGAAVAGTQKNGHVHCKDVDYDSIVHTHSR